MINLPIMCQFQNLTSVHQCEMSHSHICVKENLKVTYIYPSCNKESDSNDNLNQLLETDDNNLFFKDFLIKMQISIAVVSKDLRILKSLELNDLCGNLNLKKH